MARKPQGPALLVRVLTDIGRGNISEQFIASEDAFVHGQTCGRHVTINPAISVVDTLIHECLHRIEPQWSENYVRRTTTYLLRRMSDAQIQALYDEYQRIRRRVGRAGKNASSASSKIRAGRRRSARCAAGRGG